VISAALQGSDLAPSFHELAVLSDEIDGIFKQSMFQEPIDLLSSDALQNACRMVTAWEE
jgi:hypothetical protein